MGSLFPFLITVLLRNSFVTSIIALILIDLPKKFPFDSPHPTKPHTASTIHFATIFILKLIGMSYTQTQRKGSSIDPLSVDYRPLSFPPVPWGSYHNSKGFASEPYLNPSFQRSKKWRGSTQYLWSSHLFAFQSYSFESPNVEVSLS